MKDNSNAQTVLVMLGALLTATSVAAGVTGVRPDLRGNNGVIEIAAAAGLPQWNIAEICATDSAGGQCRVLEAEALRTLSGGWSAVPESFRNACLGSLKSPYDKSYRLLSQCLEGQVLRGLDKERIDTAQTAGKLAQAAPARTDVPAAAPPVAAGAAGLAVLPTTSTGDLFKARESWGKGGEAKAVAAPLAAGAVSPLPKEEVALPKGFAGQPSVHPLQASPAAQLTPIAPDQISGALKNLLAEREGWLKGTAAPAAQAAAPAGASTAPAAPSGYAVLPVTSTADLFKAREGWGTGAAAKAVEAPLAAGAYSPLPKDEVALPKGFEGQPTVHPLQATPAAQLAPIAPDQISGALKKLLAEREGWLKGTSAPQAAAPPAAPAASAPAAAPAAGSGYAILPTTSTADLVKARETWGRGGEAKAVAAPLAAGAVSPLPKNEFTLPKGFEGQPTVHALKATPAPQPTAVPQDTIADAMKKLLAERAGWGTAPGTPGAKTAAAPAAAPAAPKSAEAADCEAKLKSAAAKGVILFRTSSADIDTKSNATLDALAAVAKGCSKGSIRVEGHTDSTGRAAYNTSLSEQRAAAVAAYLVKAGVPKDRVSSAGYGSEKPVAANDTAEGRAKNRRIAFTVVD